MTPESLYAQWDLILRLIIAFALGAAIGLEREYTRHPAGLRTMALVAGGSCLFTSIGAYIGLQHTDPTRIAAQVVTGIGFLGAGAILRQQDQVKGLTTAATIWTVAAVGMAAGLGLFLVAIAATVLTLVVLIFIGVVEKRAEAALARTHRDQP